MASIPSKQLHRSGTLADLQANLSDREIGFCTVDHLAYYKLDGVLFPIATGSSVEGTPGEIDVEHIGGAGADRYVVSLADSVVADIEDAVSHAHTSGNPHNTRIADISGLETRLSTETAEREAADTALSTEIDAKVSAYGLEMTYLNTNTLKFYRPTLG